jgi:hypothetical protein
VCDGHGNSPPATLEEEAVKTNLKRAFVSAAAIGVFSTALAGVEPLPGAAPLPERTATLPVRVEWAALEFP